MLQHSQCARWGLGAYFIVCDQNGEKSRESAALPQALICPLALRAQLSSLDLLLYTRVSISDKKDRGARPFVKVERRATKPIFYHWRAGGFETVAHSQGFSTRVVDVFEQSDFRDTFAFGNKWGIVISG